MSRRLGVAAAVVNGELAAGDVTVDGGVVSAVGVGPAGSRGLAVPGFVDVQVNGFAGVDFTDAGVDGFRMAATAMAATGVTAFQPTLISLPEETTVAALGRLAQAHAEVTDARILGAHLEGPFLSRSRPGAHDPDALVDPDLELVDRLIAAGPVSHVTLAPELPGGLDLISHLVTRGITVALGHSDADAATAHAAFDLGARAVTHLFNAQRPFHHRDPGLGVAGLVHPGVTVTLIVDGIHLSADTVLLAFQAAPGRCALVTDAVAAAGLTDGSYRLGNRQVRLTGAEVRLEDGTLAGSALTMDRAVRNLIELGIGLVEAVAAATTVPARLIGKPELGTLAPDTPADIVVLDDRHEVVRTLVSGEEIIG